MTLSLQEQLDKLLTSATADSHKIPGVILFAANKSGKTLFHGSSGIRHIGKTEPIHNDDIGWIASLSKLPTAISVLQLVEQGKVNLDAPVDGTLHEFAQRVYVDENGKEQSHDVPITLRHLLTHTSGFTYDGYVPGAVEGQKARYIPGAKWDYGTGLDWAGILVSRVSGLSLEDYFRQNIFQPLGIKAMSFNPAAHGLESRHFGGHQRDSQGKLEAESAGWSKPNPDLSPVSGGGSGLFGNVAEYGQILIALLNNGTHPSGGKILQPASVDVLFKPQLSPQLVDSLCNWMPEVTLPVAYMQPKDAPPLRRQWAFGGEMVLDGTPTGRSSDSIYWSGACNCYWFCDRRNGDCAVLQTQIWPYSDPAVLELFFGTIEPVIHAETKAAHDG